MLNKPLLEEIEKKRIELFEIAFNNGFTSPVSLQISMELDVLVNQYQQELINH